ncbi:hypothetical protein [Rhodovulum viride]|uniref:hypothetical protein n=1 Tax=Rhodovulum viride TaxID=1231134 RepID=UPI00319E0681
MLYAVTNAAPRGLECPSCRSTTKEFPIDAHLLAVLILSPFVVAFLYAGIHEYLRFRSEGRASYGLVFDEETGTSYVTGIGEDQEGFDPEEFNPDAYNDPDTADAPEDSRG